MTWYDKYSISHCRIARKYWYRFECVDNWIVFVPTCTIISICIVFKVKRSTKVDFWTFCEKKKSEWALFWYDSIYHRYGRKAVELTLKWDEEDFSAQPNHINVTFINFFHFNNIIWEWAEVKVFAIHGELLQLIHVMIWAPTALADTYPAHY